VNRLITRTASETMALAARLGRRARALDVVCLAGELGAGKTTFVQGFARGAGFRGRATSPTFGIARNYKARRVALHHLDLYRVGPRDIVNLGLEEYLEDPQAACLIEWPEAARKALPADRLEILFEHRPDGGRSVELRALGPRSRRLLGARA